MRLSPSVYLGGPISDLGYEQALAWRTDVKDRLEKFGILAICPMRAKAALKPLRRLAKTGANFAGITPLLTSKAIYARDKFDVTRSAVVLMNLLEARRISQGSLVEIGWASAKDIPIILVLPKKNSIHDHLLVREAASVITHDLDAAVEAVIGMLK